MQLVKKQTVIKSLNFFLGLVAIGLVMYALS